LSFGCEEHGAERHPRLAVTVEQIGILDDGDRLLGRPQRLLQFAIMSERLGPRGAPQEL
jgi:hypothetical protein